MFGCHNCEHSGKLSGDYESSPCASCRTAKPPSIQNHAWHVADPAMFGYGAVLHPAYEYMDGSGKTSRLLIALSKCVKQLVALEKSSPATYGMVMAKLENPELAYSEIAKLFKCRKQNVLYHFKKAVRLFPELTGALLVDRRFLAAGQVSPVSAKARRGA